MLGYCKLDPWEQMSMIFQSKYKIAIHENATENIVSEMASIISNGRWVKTFFCGWSNLPHSCIYPFTFVQLKPH